MSTSDLVDYDLTPPLKVFVIAGERSGDQRAAEVVHALRARLPYATFRGMGGDCLERAGVFLEVDSRIVGGVMGFTEVVTSVRALRKAFLTLRTCLHEWRPHVVLLVDFPDFNLRFARVARAAGIATVYYIPPKVWAWRRNRIRLLDKYVDTTISILPFEKDFHSQHGYLRTIYVGHPLIETLTKGTQELRMPHPVEPSHIKVAILPGSRKAEILRHLPLMIKGFDLARKDNPHLKGVIAVPPHFQKLVTSLLTSLGSTLIDVSTVDAVTLMKNSDFGLLKSGTCNLEGALIGLPHIVVYKTSHLSAAIARRFIRLTEFSPVNILAKETVPELIQDRCTPQLISEELGSLIRSPTKSLEQQKRFLSIRTLLESSTSHPAIRPESEPSQRAADIIAHIAKNPLSFIPLWSQVFRYLTPYKYQFISALLAMVVFGATDGAVPFVAKYALDNVLSGQNARYLYLFPVLLLSLSLVRATGDFFQQFLNARIGHLIIRDIRNDINEKILRLPPGYFVEQASGDVLARVTSDVLLLRMLLTDSVSAVVRDSIRVVALAIAALSMDPFLALIAVTGFPLAVYPIYRFGRKMRSLSRRGQDAIGVVSNMISESMAGSRVIKIFQGEHREISRFRGQNDTLTSTFIRSERVRALTGPLSEIFASVAISAVILYGGASVMAHTRTQGEFIAFLVAVFLLYDPFKRLSRVSASVQQGLAGAQRIFELLNADEVIAEKSETVPFPSDTPIELKNVSFSYHGLYGKKVVDTISLKIPQGECLGIVGFSGSGKTTLVDLLPRFIDPTEGAIFIGGIDTRSLALADLRAHLAMVSQHTFLFNDTVRANIAYGKAGATDEEIIEAAAKAYALSFITALPHGFDTKVGESGFSLSGGERQRIAIARALLKDAPILILDEATASLDNQSEREVQKALEALRQGRTTLIIAHRLSSIQNADRVAVMRHGKIVEEGSPRELLKNQGEYAALYKEGQRLEE